MTMGIAAGTIAVVLNSDRSHVLLHLRRDLKKWGLPGGSCDFGESYAQTIEREVVEETGIEIKIIRVFGAFSNPTNCIFKYPDGNSVHGFMLGFECEAVGGRLLSSCDESEDVRWWSLAEPLPDLLPNHRPIWASWQSANEFALD